MKNVENTDQDFVRPVDLDHEAGSVIYPAFVLFSLLFLLFLQPLPGTKEILQNSVILVTFLQLPLAVFSGSMLRTTLIVDVLPPTAQRLLRTLCYVLGFALFGAIGYATLPEAFDAFRIGEYEGEGALRVPTYPVRLLIVLTSVFAAFVYLYLIVLDWTNRLDDEGAPIESLPSAESHGG